MPKRSALAIFSPELESSLVRGRAPPSPGFARIWARIQGRIGPGLAQDSLSNLVAGFTQDGQAVRSPNSL